MRFFLRAGTGDLEALKTYAGQCSHRLTVGSGDVAPFLSLHLSIQQKSTIPFFSPSSPMEEETFSWQIHTMKTQCWLALGRSTRMHRLTLAPNR